MIKPPQRSKDVIAGDDVFHVASLVLYVALQLYVGLNARHLLPSSVSVAAVALLALLFLFALMRNFRPHARGHGQGRILLEMAVAVAVVAVLTLQHAIPPYPSPWLIGIAGVFALAIRGAMSLVSIIAIAVIGVGLNESLHIPVGEWLTHAFATVLVGVLSIFLAKSSRINLKAMREARMIGRHFDTVARTTRHIFMITDAQYKVKYANPALKDVIGYTADEIEDARIQVIVHPADKEEHQRKLRFLRATPHSSIFSRHRAQHKNGHWVWMEANGYNMLHDSAINGLVFSIEDISERESAERRLAEEHALLRAVLDHNPAMIYAKDTEGRFTISNQSFQRRFGFSSEGDLRGKTSYEIFLSQAAEGHELEAYEMADQIHLQDLKVIDSGIPLEDLEIQGLWESDLRRWYRTNKYPLRDAHGQTVGVLGIMRDNTERKDYEMLLEHQAMHDALTGLPNRRALLNTVAAAIEESRSNRRKLVMLFCDLDFFKSVNDTHGHDFGDKCLVELTRRIVAALPAQDFVARFGGNEFIILTNTSLLKAKLKAEAVRQVVSAPLVIDEIVVKIQTSIGIAQLSPNHGGPSELIRDADAAMYQAKERGRNRAEFFDVSLQNSTTKRAQMDVALRFALERDELTLVYQPKVSMLDGMIKGFELLLRWNSSQYGHIPPTEFIPVAETSGLVVPIGLWVLEEACKQLSTWQAKYPALADITIAVNVSMRQLRQASFLAEVTSILKNTQVLPQSIELELTETSAMANPLQTVETLSMLRQLGLRVALDDFGTGYSSLAYLQKLPINVLKIDRAFVHGLGKNPSDAEIVRLILTLAQTLNLETVAEGVETTAHVSKLKELGCTLAQGYVFSPAVPADEAEALLRSSRRFLVA